MALPKITAPQPQIFNSDPLEQVFARGITEDKGLGNNGGLDYMFLNAFGDRRRMDQEAYLEGVRQANKLAFISDAIEQQQKMQAEGLKAGTELAKLGFDMTPELVRAAMLDPAKASVMTNLLQAFKQSQINENNAKAAHAGDAGADNVTVRSETVGGNPGVITITGKTKGDPNKMQDRVNQMTLQQLQNGPKSTALTPEQRMAIERSRLGQ